MFQQRVRNSIDDIPDNAVFLAYSNEKVDYLNRMQMEKKGLNSEFFVNKFRCIETGDNSIKNQAEFERLFAIVKKNAEKAGKAKQMASGQNKDDSMPSEIILQIGIKYMITRNINVDDGLLNGRCGILREMQLDSTGRYAELLW